MIATNQFELGQQFLDAVMLQVNVVEPQPLHRLISLIGSSTFMQTNYRLNWLAKRLLVRDQPAFMGGPKKALKTSLLADLAICLSTGRYVFGHFPVEECVRVGVLSGESGEATIQETARRICRAKGIRAPESLNIRWGFRLPQLSNRDHLEQLDRAIRDEGLEVLIIDPLYLCLLAGNSGKQASNLYDTGPLLSEATQLCLAAGATPVFAHHTRKLGRNPYQPIDLDDLAFSGVQEFARQWILINRREKFDPDTGTHRLWLSIGGSVGHSGLYALDVDEGRLNDDFSGRKWEVTVTSGKDAIRAKQGRRAQEKVDRDSEARQRIVTFLEDYPGGETSTAISKEARIPKDSIRKILDELVNQKLLVVARDVVKCAGGAGRRPYPGYKLAKYAAGET